MMFKRPKIQDNAAAERRRWTGGEAVDQTWHRLVRYGPEALAGWELLSWLLGPGGRTAAEQVARDLLAQRRGIVGLAATSPAELARLPGVGRTRARRLAAAFELGSRAAGSRVRTGFLVRRPEDLQDSLRTEFRGLDRERFLALYLDSRHRIEAVETVSIGSLNASLVHPREVFKPAVALSAAAIIVAHNHPSGDPRPSGDDLALTARLDRCGDLLGIALLDHLVVGDGAVTSIREYGWPVAGVE